MKDFDTIRSPYRESPEYLDNLLERCREKALGSQERPSARVRPWLYGIAAALAIAVVAFALTLNTSRKTPMERFLAGLSDEEAATLVVYDFADDNTE